MNRWICGCFAFLLCVFQTQAEYNAQDTAQVHGRRVIDVSAVPLTQERRARLERRKGNDESIEWIIPIAFERDALNSDIIEAYLFDTHVIIRRDAGTPRVLENGAAKGYTHWEGEVLSTGDIKDHQYMGPRNATFYISPNGQVVGTIRVGQIVYQVRGSGRDNYSLSKKDLRTMSGDGNDVFVPDTDLPVDDGGGQDPAWFPGIPSPIPPRQIHTADVLVAFSNQAEGHDQLEFLTEVRAALTEAGKAYQRSDIELYLNVAAFARPNYNEVSIERTLSDLRRGADGPLWLAHTGRANSYADVILMVVMGNDSWPCGGVHNIGSTRNTAYFVVRRGCFEYGSIAHELGHLLGANHNIEAAGSPSMYSYGHGHINDAPMGAPVGWSTIMAVESTCLNWCPRIQYFSDPKKYYNGVLRGSSLSDNVRAILQNYGILANYYTRPRQSSGLREMASQMYTPKGGYWLHE